MHVIEIYIGFITCRFLNGPHTNVDFILQRENISAFRGLVLWDHFVLGNALEGIKE